MAAERTLKITIVGDASSAEKAFRVTGASAGEADSKLGRFGDAMGKLGTIAGGVFAGGALLAAPGGLLDMAKGAADDAASTERLEQAIKNASGSFAPYSEAINKAIADGQALAFSDDDTRGALAMLTAQTGDTEEALRRLSLAQDLARGTGMDLGTASRLLGKVTDETINVLGRYGIRVEKGADAQALLNAVDQKFKGQAAALAASDAGKWAKMTDQIDEAEEAIGYRLVPVLAGLTAFVSEQVIPAITYLTNNVGDFVPALAALAAIILAVVVPAFIAWAASAASAAAATIIALAPVLVPLAAIGAAAALLAAGWQNNWGGMRDTLTRVGAVVQRLITDTMLPPLRQLWATIGPQFQAVMPQFQALWKSLQPILSVLGKIIGGVLVVALGTLMATLGGLVGLFAGVLPGAIQLVTGAVQVLSGVFQLIGAVVSTVFQLIVALVTGQWSSLGDILTAGTERMREAVVGIWSGIKDMVVGLVTGLVGGVLGLVDGLAATLVGYFGGIYTMLTGSTAMTWQQIKDTIGASLTAAWEWIQAIWNGAVVYLAGIWGAITSTLTGAWNGLTAFLGTTLDGWRDFIVTRLTAVRDTFTSIFDAIGVFVMSALNAVRDYIYGRLDAIRSDFAAIWGLIQATVTALAETMVGKIILAIIELGSTILDELGKTKDALGRLWEALVNFALSKVRELYDRVTEKVVQLRDYIADRINETLTNWQLIWDKVSTYATDTWTTIKTFFVNSAAAMLAAIRGPFDDARDRVSEAWEKLKTTATDTWDAVKKYATDGLTAMSDAIKQPFEDARDLANSAWEKLKTTATDTWDAVKKYATDGLTAMQSAITAPFSGAKSAIQGVWEGIDLYISGPQGALATIQGRFDTARDAIRGAVVKPFEDARDAIGSVMNAFGQNIVNSLRAAVGKVTSFGNGVRDIINWVAEKLGASTIVPKAPEPAIDNMPGYARGTDYHPGGWAIVGEQGPELVNLPRGASVIPNAASMALMSGAGVPGYALGVGDLWKFIRGGAEAALNAAVSATGLVAPALSGTAFTGWGDKVWDTVKGWVKTFIGGLFGKASPISPERVQAMVKFAESKLGLPYLWGGGHGSQPDMNGPYDCSGFVRAVLAAGGINTPSWVVTDFYNWMRGGRTGIVDIGTNNATDSDPRIQHMGIGIAGQWYETGGRAGGTGRTDDYFGDVGHPPDLDNARGAGDAAYTSWLNIVTGRIRGQFGGLTSVPPFATLLDFFATNPRLFSLRNLERIQSVLPAGPVALANGGVVTRPTVALIGEDGPEAVVPLGRGGGRSALRTYNVTVNNTVGMDERQLVNWLRRLELVYG